MLLRNGWCCVTIRNVDSVAVPSVPINSTTKVSASTKQYILVIRTCYAYKTTFPYFQFFINSAIIIDCFVFVCIAEYTTPVSCISFI